MSNQLVNKKYFVFPYLQEIKYSNFNGIFPVRDLTKLYVKQQAPSIIVKLGNGDFSFTKDNPEIIMKNINRNISKKESQKVYEEEKK